MRLLKKFWELCGEEKFSLKVMIAACFFLTVLTITTTDLPLEMYGLTVLLNVLMAVIYVLGDDN